MAKRWVGGTLMGALLASWMPAAVLAQAPTDPVPIHRAPIMPGGLAHAEGIQAMPVEAMVGGAPAPMPPVDPQTGVVSEEAYRLFAGAGRRWAVYGGVGWTALRRDKLGDSALSIQNSSSFEDIVIPSAGATTVANFNDLEPKLHSGVSATVGIFTENASIEASGFYIGENTDDAQFGLLGQQFLFFFNPPLGFEGDLGLWNNADFVVLSLETSLANFEVNYRRAVNCRCGCVELLAGFRYLDVQETLSIDTDDDILLLGVSDPLSRAVYTTRTHNRLYGGQLGFALRLPLMDAVTFSWEAKGAWFLNDAEVEVSLVRGDGLVGRQGGSDHQRFASAYDMGFWIDACCKHVRVRGGYQLLWILNVAEAVEQIDYNLENANGKGNINGSIFYHGPAVSIEFLF